MTVTVVGVIDLGGAAVAMKRSFSQCIEVRKSTSNSLARSSFPNLRSSTLTGSTYRGVLRCVTIEIGSGVESDVDSDDNSEVDSSDDGQL